MTRQSPKKHSSAIFPKKTYRRLPVIYAFGQRGMSRSLSPKASQAVLFRTQRDQLQKVALKAPRPYFSLFTSNKTPLRVAQG